MISTAGASSKGRRQLTGSERVSHSSRGSGVGKLSLGRQTFQSVWPSTWEASCCWSMAGRQLGFGKKAATQRWPLSPSQNFVFGRGPSLCLELNKKAVSPKDSGQERPSTCKRCKCLRRIRAETKRIVFATLFLSNPQPDRIALYTFSVLLERDSETLRATFVGK